jgi:hypothetical protein
MHTAYLCDFALRVNYRTKSPQGARRDSNRGPEAGALTTELRHSPKILGCGVAQIGAT